MKVILKENVSNLGNVGDIVNVSPGHARNFLLPSELALIADEQNKKQLEHQQKQLEKKKEAAKNDAEEIKKKLEGFELSFEKRVAGNGRLFGAVNNSDIEKVLKEKGHPVEKRMIYIPEPIKTMGEFTVVAKLFEGVEAELKVTVTMDPKQAEENRKKQAAAAKKKKEKAAKGEETEEKTEEKSEGETKEKTKTEDQKLDDEANKIIRE